MDSVLLDREQTEEIGTLTNLLPMSHTSQGLALFACKAHPAILYHLGMLEEVRYVSLRYYLFNAA